MNFLLGGEPVIIISLFQSWNSVCVCVTQCAICIDPEVYSTHIHSTVLC